MGDAGRAGHAPLVESKAAGEPIRVWVAGAPPARKPTRSRCCSCEQLENAGKQCPLQVFATDTNDDALAIARVGAYPTGIAAQLSAERLRRYFTEIADDHHYQVRKELRESVVFGAHNLLGDPPYSKMDVVTCRNLLIYLEPEVQKKVVLLLHFALRPGGYLFLGPAETVGKHEDLFEPVSKRWRIFRRIGATRRELGRAAGAAPADARDRRGGSAAAAGAGRGRHGGPRAAADRRSLCAGRGVDEPPVRGALFLRADRSFPGATQRGTDAKPAVAGARGSAVAPAQGDPRCRNG